MIALYYLCVGIVSLIVFFLSVKFDKKKNKIGKILCYATLFLIALLFV